MIDRKDDLSLNKMAKQLNISRKSLQMTLKNELGLRSYRLLSGQILADQAKQNWMGKPKKLREFFKIPNLEKAVIQFCNSISGAAANSKEWSSTFRQNTDSLHFYEFCKGNSPESRLRVARIASSNVVVDTEPEMKPETSTDSYPLTNGGQIFSCWWLTWGNNMQENDRRIYGYNKGASQCTGNPPTLLLAERLTEKLANIRRSAIRFFKYYLINNIYGAVLTS
ncbi:hypothetical protein ANCCEY_05880 [Ancylostoma ceylanicum]|uniref:Uncharacterized protein n=1 Tax=Ancylostoma ceylanicum TaxID=53326 RepID=A0A0D6LSL4_9BILA|nr:hypothetical protein ANCCEY_05880 [Ancylostoma ceylanicum]